MHNFDDPIGFITCCYAGREIASISCVAAGSNN